MTRPLCIACIALLLVIATRPVASQEPVADPQFTILVVNDDGFHEPGLLALVDSLAPIARLVVAAPRTQQSGTGHGITHSDPIRVSTAGNPYGITWYAVDARPATCVSLALTTLLDTLPDLVVSGVNLGENVGLSAWLSGTVAGARQAVFHGVPAIAVSAGAGGFRDFAVAAGYVRALVEQLRAGGLLAHPLLLNVNVPAGGAERIRGVRVVRMSLTPGAQRFDRRLTPSGQVYYWSDRSPVADDGEGTDVHAFNRGYITVTPLSIDQTDASRMPDLRTSLGREDR
ncbi:MAG: 5'/3'-nucleotidase SurE [Gemmatimonadales bacterium]|nr:5'/3'-nucleotidase SurE [Gemmatimonadales bacterium]NIN50695.1 5'/3'-nucleotidase SurE [Gemmatimonadales bacterium]NIP08159.1 5'/3'-nucleotidase SurE [Gemmatimonadales bacterium]NIR01037.1 5'/3'-nucleotidase SurE [Gemmatimonadales bacterium]NIS65116.1 5'/3'-nucleotidase SurE [Gemmatimonadales bacterium]